MTNDCKQTVFPKKRYGQNFITNPHVCPKMVDAAGISAEFGVLEIGAGLGVLTKAIAAKARKTVAVEIDRDLIARLRENLSGCGDVEILEGDALRLNLPELIQERFFGMRVAAMGNLPYYITTPILMKLLEQKIPLEHITVMIQKDAAVRICAPPGTRQSGAITLAVRYFGTPRLLFDVSPGSFFPRPKVMSSVVKIEIHKTPAVVPADERKMFLLIKAAFAQRRKTLLNAVSAGLGMDKTGVRQAMERCALPLEIRPERLLLEDYANLSDALFGGRAFL